MPLLAPTSLDRGLTAKVQNLTGIPETNLRRWRRLIAEDPEWQPWHTQHGEHRRVFSALEETAIVPFIVDKCISQGLIFTDADFREVAMNAFLSKYSPSKDLPPPFQCSAGFINSFKSRNRLTSQKIHYKRRPAVTEDQRQKWIGMIRELVQTVPSSRIVPATKPPSFSIQTGS
jgi:hypothetical protein